MANTRQWRRFRPNRMELLSIGGALIAIPLYLAVLYVLDGRAETYFENLRDEDTELYLTQLRESRGFSAYVDEYRDILGYDTVKEAAPSFLVGRWTMRPEPLRLTPGTPPGHCIDPITFDYGIVLMAQGGAGAFEAGYRIEGQKVQIESPGDRSFAVDLVSYGARLDHLEFQPPGRDEPVFAYNCAG